MKKIIILTSLLLLVLLNNKVQAQDETDVNKFSQTNLIGTARSLGVGGAMGSIGGDFSAININPAGLGKYNKGEFAFTTSLNLNNTSSKYNNADYTNNKSKLLLNNIGIVVANNVNKNRYGRGRSNSNGWKTSNFAIGYNRVANFNKEYNFYGKNSSNSLITALASNVNKIPGGGYANIGSADPLSQMAYEVFLLDTTKTDNYNLYSFVPTALLGQSKHVDENGGINEFSLSIAGNNNDKIFLGASLGIPIVNYKRTTTYTETDLSGNTNNDFNNFSYLETLTTSGAGINLKLGAIFIPVPSVRLGLAFHTPTYYTLSETSNYSMSANLENYTSNNTINTTVDKYLNISDYTISSPFKTILSGSYFVGKRGFLSADLEILNYASAKIGFAGTDASTVSYQNSVNNVLKANNQRAQNLRLGAELRGNLLSGRIGFAFYGSPTTTNIFNAARNSFSLGGGYHLNNFFTDIAWVYTTQKNSDYFYVLNNSNGYNLMPTASILNNNQFLTLTMGWKL